MTSHSDRHHDLDHDGIRDTDRVERIHDTPDLPTAGGAIISGHGDAVPDQTEGGLVESGHGDLVGDETEGGEIVEGRGDAVPQNGRTGREVFDESRGRGHGHRGGAEHVERDATVPLQNGRVDHTENVGGARDVDGVRNDDVIRNDNGVRDIDPMDDDRLEGGRGRHARN